MLCGVDSAVAFAYNGVKANKEGGVDSVVVFGDRSAIASRLIVGYIDRVIVGKGIYEPRLRRSTDFLAV